MRKVNKTYQEIQLDCHPGSLLAGVSLGFVRKGSEQAICIGKKSAGDPGQKPSGMTTLLKKLSGKALTYNGGSPSPLVGEGARRAGEGLSRAFTLIELLVVILIIGILAAVALPQYQKTIEQARAREALVNLKTLTEAASVYKLEHGQGPSSASELDISLSGSSFFNYTVLKRSTGLGFEAVAWRKDNGNKQLKYYIYYGYDGKLNCVTTDDSALPICLHLCKIRQPNETRKDGLRYCNVPGFRV